MRRFFLLAVTPAWLWAQQPPPAKPPVAAAPKPAAPAAPKAAAVPAAKPAVAAPKPPAVPARKPPIVPGVKPGAPAALAKERALPLTTDDAKIIYAVGLSIGKSLKQFDLSPAEMETIKQALSDSLDNKPAIDINEWGPRINSLVQVRAARLADREKASAKVFLDAAAAEPGARRTASGLVFKDITPGTGPSPKDSDTVKVHYRGTLVDGTEFDSSYKRNEPAEFPLNQVVKCWTEGVQLMKVGGKARLVCPSDLAYGDRGSPPTIPGGATLIFEIELLGIPSAAK